MNNLTLAEMRTHCEAVIRAARTGKVEMNHDRAQLKALGNHQSDDQGEAIIYLPESEFKRMHALLAQAHKSMEVVHEMERHHRESAESWRKIAERNALLVRKYKEEADSLRLELSALQAQVFAGVVR